MASTGVTVAGIDPRAHAEALADVAAMLAARIAQYEQCDHVLPSELARMRRRFDAAARAAREAWAAAEDDSPHQLQLY